MDTLTQGLLGATAAQLCFGHKLGHRAWIAGMAGGMLPDADVFLQPLADPALPWSLHRHFTHALVLAPVMGLLAAVPLLCVRRMRGAMRAVAGASVVGAMTHGPLDWCTSYGTMLLWPFSSIAYTIDLYPIVDPLFTVVLALCVVWAARRRSRGPAVVAAVFLALYSGAALVQQDRANEAQATIAQARGHAVERGRVMPLPGSLLLWRSLYETDRTVYADTVRCAPRGAVSWRAGDHVRVARVREGLRKRSPTVDTRRVLDVWSRFARFADGYVAWSPQDDRLLADLRMSSSFGIAPIWGVRFDESGPLRWAMPDRSLDTIRTLWDAMWGDDTRLVPLYADAMPPRR